MDTIYTEGHRHFYREMPDYDFGGQRVSIASPKNTAKDVGIRLYCTMFDTAWALQIRGFFQNRNLKKGKTWYYANADLSVNDLRALRDACDAALKNIDSKAA